MKEALKLAPKDPLRRVLMARVKLESAMDFDGAESEVTQALAVNPNLAGGLLRARRARAPRHGHRRRRRRRRPRASRSNPNDLELLSMKAASRFLADDAAGLRGQKSEGLRA